MKIINPHVNCGWFHTRFVIFCSTLPGGLTALVALGLNDHAAAKRPAGRAMESGHL